MANTITVHGAKQLDNGLFDLSMVNIFVRTETGKIVDRESGLKVKTAKGWASKKPVITELEVISRTDEESEEGEVYCDVVITETCYKYLVENFTGSKYWLGTAEQQTIHRSQCAYNSLASKLHDPEL